MEKKKILIAETNKPQDIFMKDALIRNNIDIEILNEEPLNSKDMKQIILKIKPNIVITNERKKDKPASDIICEIQKDKTIKQPIFILVSGFQKSDIEYTIKSKEIEVYTVYKPYDFDELANNIKYLLNKIE